MYKDKDKQKQANRDASERYRSKKGMTQGMTQGMTEQGMTDGLAATLDELKATRSSASYKAAVLADPIGQPSIRETLESWAKREGTEYQRQLGILAMQYSVIKGIDWPGSKEIMEANKDYCRQEGYEA